MNQLPPCTNLHTLPFFNEGCTNGAVLRITIVERIGWRWTAVLMPAVTRLTLVKESVSTSYGCGVPLAYLLSFAVYIWCRPRSSSRSRSAIFLHGQSTYSLSSPNSVEILNLSTESRTLFTCSKSFARDYIHPSGFHPSGDLPRRERAISKLLSGSLLHLVLNLTIPPSG